MISRIELSDLNFTIPACTLPLIAAPPAALRWTIVLFTGRNSKPISTGRPRFAADPAHVLAAGPSVSVQYPRLVWPGLRRLVPERCRSRRRPDRRRPGLDGSRLYAVVRASKVGPTIAGQRRRHHRVQRIRLGSERVCPSEEEGVVSQFFGHRRCRSVPWVQCRLRRQRQ